MFEADNVDACDSLCDMQDKFRNAIWQFDKMYGVLIFLN